MHSHDYFAIPIAEVVAETDSAVSLILDVPEELTEAFRYQPGQFLTVRLLIDGKFRHRCYSLSSAPDLDAKHKITIKRVDGGLVSNVVCGTLRAGQTLLVQPPAGHFIPSSMDSDFLLFAGGSGITPVMSIVKAALVGGKGRILLFYANRDERSVIFGDELARLSLAHPERFAVMHWLETVQGLPDARQIAAMVAPWAASEVFICGPGPFMDGVSQALHGLEVDDHRVHFERFVSLPDDDVSEAPTQQSIGPDVNLAVTIDGERHELLWPRSAKLLDTMLEHGIDAPFSCRVGGCSACMCRIERGQVRMANNLVLDEHEIAEGWVLACQSYAEADEVEVDIPS